MKQPKVTVGLGVHNGEKTLGAALDSLLDQSLQDISIFISDNASTDATAAICKRRAADHPNVIYHRHEKKLSIAENFRFALSLAKTDYFMWLAADDEIASSFIAKNHDFLHENPDYVSSQGRVLLHSDHVPTRYSNGTFKLSGTTADNMTAFLRRPADNSRFYGLFRTAALRASYPNGEIYAFDWAASLGTLLQGSQNEIDETLMLRDETPASDYLSSYRDYPGTGLARLFPVFPLSKYLLRHYRILRHPKPLLALLRLNILIAVRFASYGAYHAALDRLNRTSVGIGAALARLAVSITAPDLISRIKAPWRRANGMLGNFAKPSQTPQPIVPQDSGWRRFPDTTDIRPQISVILIVQDALENTLRLMQTIAQAAASCSFEIILVDCGSVDATPLLFRKRTDLAYIPCLATSTFEQAVQVSASRARGETLIFIEPNCRLHFGALRELAGGLADADMCGPVCLADEAFAGDEEMHKAAHPDEVYGELGTPFSSGHNGGAQKAEYCLGAFALSGETLGRHLAAPGAGYMTHAGFSAELSARIWRDGGRVIMQPSAVVSRRPQPNKKRENADWRQIFVRGAR